jgi:excinuclease ABC subunit A
VIEHNIEMIKSADYIVDLGPEGGDMGGYVVAFGPPEEIIQNRESFTGEILKNILCEKIHV